VIVGKIPQKSPFGSCVRVTHIVVRQVEHARLFFRTLRPSSRNWLGDHSVIHRSVADIDWNASHSMDLDNFALTQLGDSPQRFGTPENGGEERCAWSWITGFGGRAIASDSWLAANYRPSSSCRPSLDEEPYSEAIFPASAFSPDLHSVVMQLLF
jgi:hypothetical protein